MPSTTAEPSDKDDRISIRWDAVHWAAWTKLAHREGYDPVDYIKMMVIKAITEANPPVLESEEKTRLLRLARLIKRVVEIAVTMYRNGEFSEDITLHVFQRAMDDAAFRKDYIAHIGGGDPYAHGNPQKDVNRELGYRIKKALPADIVKDKDGKRVERRNLKEQVIQSYTLLKLREAA